LCEDDTGSRSLGEFPLDVVRIDCQRCGRAGSYRRDGLVARFGADIALPDLLVALASCERRADFSKPCGGHCHGAPGLRRSRLPGSRTRMNKISYSGYRFAPEIIHQAIWLYLRFTLSLRDVEDLLAERGVAVSYETVRALGESFRTDDRSRPTEASPKTSYDLAVRDLLIRESPF